MAHECDAGRNPTISTGGKVRPIFQITSTVDRDPSATCENASCLTNIPHFFHWWLKIGYFGLCIPFKPTLDRNSRTHKLQSNKLQKVHRVNEFSKALLNVHFNIKSNIF